MRRTQDAHSEPTAALDRHVKGYIPDASVRYDILASKRLPVYYEFHGHFARASDARSLEMPIWCLINRPIMDVVRRTIAVVESSPPEVISSVRRYAVASGRNGAEVSRHLHSSVHCPSSYQPHLARIRSHLNVVHAEVHQMAPAIGHVASAGAQRLYPAAVTERPVNLGVYTTLPDAGVCDAREICLSGDARAEPDIQRVIPNVELPGVRCVHGGNEIDRVGMRHVHNVFVSSNGVEARNFVIWKLA